MSIKTLSCFFLMCFAMVNMQFSSHARTNDSLTATPDLSSLTATPTPDTPVYLDYTTFTTLTGLAPEVPQPRLAGGTTEAGYQLWAKGQMRIPAAGYFVQGDFVGDGRLEAALLFTSKGQYYLLIADQHGQQWFRQALFPLQAEAQLAWDGTILRLSPSPMFIVWDGQAFYMSHTALDAYAYDYADADFTGVVIKFTYIGPQDEPYPSLLISSYYRLPNPDIFK